MYLTSSKDNDNLQEYGTFHKVKCTADCVPECYIVWLNDAENVIWDKNTLDELYFPNISRHEAGTYTCLAVNPGTGKSINKTISIGVTCES